MIAARDLCKRFGGTPVLRDLDLDIARGRVTAIVGPNGAGKTTFIKALLGLVKPDSGLLTFNGAPVGAAPAYRAQVGYMPQIAQFPENLTGADFLALLRELRGVAETDERLIDEFGIRASLDKRLRVLSGGTRQKVNAAAAFLFSPTLYVLDEPTTGLDPVSSGILKRRVLEEREHGSTVILTSHILADVDELADDVVFLHEGQARFAGNVRELKRQTAQATTERAIAALMLGERAA
ncbi:MAG: ABC transporter ATP-binding protein [Gemmatimonadaceae bacterium]